MHTRRAFVAAGAGTLAALAGCTGGETGGEGSGGGTETAGTPRPPQLLDHPAAEGIENQPTLGPAVTDATAVIVAFEDPSCVLCRRFEENTFPELRSELVDTGQLAFVYRGYPIIYPWGEPASQALESTYAASEDAFWALKDHYYGEQGSFDTDNVLVETEAFLASETDVDAGAVVEDARNERHDDAVQADLAAGEAAGVGSQTPVFYLFRDGVFRTRVSGPQGYDVFAAALGF